MKVLVADDSATMRRIIKNTLLDIGADEVIEAEDGLDAWNKLNESEGITTILTDWNMPKMNGLEFVIKVRADDRFKDRPIIMITTEGGKGEVVKAIKAGVNNYIVKPFTPQVLKEKLEAVLGVNDED